MDDRRDEALCRVAVSRGYLAPSQAEVVLRDAADARQLALAFDLGGALVLRSLLTQAQLDELVQVLDSERTKHEVFDAVTQVVHADRAPPPRTTPHPSGGRAAAPPPSSPPSRTPTPRPFPAPGAKPTARTPTTQPGGVPREAPAGAVGQAVAIAGVTALLFALGAYFVVKSDRSEALLPSIPREERKSESSAPPIRPVEATRGQPLPPARPPEVSLAPAPPNVPPAPPARQDPKPPKRAPPQAPSPVFALLEQAVAVADSEDPIEADRLLERAAGVAGISQECRGAIEEERRRLASRPEAMSRARASELGGDLDAARRGFMAALSCESLASAVSAAAISPSDQSAARTCLEQRFHNLVRTAIEARADLHLVEAFTAYEIALTLHKRLGMTCDASGARSSRDELARRLRGLLPQDGESEAESDED